LKYSLVIRREFKNLQKNEQLLRYTQFFGSFARTPHHVPRLINSSSSPFAHFHDSDSEDDMNFSTSDDDSEHDVDSENSDDSSDDGSSFANNNPHLFFGGLPSFPFHF